jgi:prepilin-type N-terminal cleavage/methylation domain-containing protein
MKNNKINKSAFTIIELVIVVSILAMLMMMSYAPYMFYQDKLRVKLASKDIGQVLYTYRNLAIH